ncbi:hypothetical protein J567_4547, partial [Acinetobacter baumannii 754286]|uniref:hypothetical protein n=1 Tax=Acinetobacter baumannii TaxID=470 RepID=UPI00049F3EAA
ISSIFTIIINNYTKTTPYFFIYSAPANWTKIVYYTERLRDIEIGLRNKDIARCWLGSEKIPHNNSKGPPLRSSVELFDAVDELFIDSEKNKEIWSGFGVVINNNGKYTIFVQL